MASIQDALAAAIPASALQPPDGAKLPTSKKPDAAVPEDKKSAGTAMAQSMKDQEVTDSARKERDVAESNVPKFPDLAPEPKPDAPDPMKGYTSAIGVLGAIGSMFTRRPMVNTMNAAAASIQAMNSKEAADFDKKFQMWKVENDNAFKLLDYQNKIYDSILKDKNTSVDQRIAEAAAHAAAFKDDVMADHLKRGDIIAAEELNLKRQEAGDKASEYANKLQEQKEKRDLMSQWKKENPNAKAIDAAVAYNQIMDGKAPPKAAAGVTFSEGAIEANARALITGATPASLGLSRNSPNYIAVINRASELNPDFDPAISQMDYKAGNKALASVETRAANINLAANSLDKAIPLLRSAAEKGDLGQYEDINALDNYAKAHRGETDIVALNLAVQTVVSDYASLINRGAPVTVEARTAAAGVVNAAMSEGQINSVLDQIEREKQAQQSAAEITIKEAKKTALGGSKESLGAEKSPYPEYPDARKAPDGGWYVQKDGKYYKIGD